LNSINIADLLLGVNLGETAGAGVPAVPQKTSEGSADVFSAILAQNRMSGLLRGGKPFDEGAAAAGGNLPPSGTTLSVFPQPASPEGDETLSENIVSQPWSAVHQYVELRPGAGPNPQQPGEDVTALAEETTSNPGTEKQISDRGLSSSVFYKTSGSGGFPGLGIPGKISLLNPSTARTGDLQVNTAPGEVFVETGGPVPEKFVTEAPLSREPGSRIPEEFPANRPAVAPVLRQSGLDTSPAGSSVQLKLAQSAPPAVEEHVPSAPAEKDVQVQSAAAFFPRVEARVRQTGNNRILADHKSDGLLSDESADTGLISGADTKPAPVTSILNSRFNPAGTPAGKHSPPLDTAAGRGGIFEMETVSTLDATTHTGEPATPEGLLVVNTVPGNERPRAEIITVASGKSDVGPAVDREVHRFVDGLDGRDGAHRARVRINPPELGKVSIHVVVRDKAVELDLTVENRDVKALLETHAEGLRAELSEKGFTLENFNVSTSDAHQDPDQTGRQGRYRSVSGDDPDAAYTDGRFTNQILTETTVNMLA
jgi:hypothetical protein